jgi:hypothetical protein
MKLRYAFALASFCIGLTGSGRARADGGAASSLNGDPHASNPFSTTSTWVDALFVGQSLVSDNCYYHLDMQGDGNLVLYAGPGTGSARWATNTRGHDEPYAIVQGDGNFVVYNIDPMQTLWNAGTSRGARSVLWLQNDGNLVVYPATSPGKDYWWASWTNGYDPGAPASCSMTASYTEMWANEYARGPEVVGGFCDNGASTGGDLAGANEGEASCGNACALDAACSAWTYYPNAATSYPTGNMSCPSSGACFLLGPANTQPAVGSYAGAVTGLKVIY